MAAALVRPRMIGWLALGLAVVFFPYMHTWPGFAWFLRNLASTTGINLSIFQVTSLGVWLVILLGLNLLTGYSGQISLGHSALVAAGAYIVAILLQHTGTPIAVAVLAGGLGAGALGFAIGIPSLRLTGPYLAIATLALVVSLPQILKETDPFDIARWTGGSTGIDLSTARVPGTVSGLMDDRQWLYYSTMVPALAMTVLAWNLTRSRVGRAFIAIRDSEIGAQQMGVNVALYKTLAFGVSALYAGVGGGLFVYTQDFVSPESFSTFQSITFLVSIVIGGLSSILGGVFAAVFFTFQSGVIAKLADYLPAVDRLRWAIYGGALIIVMIFLPTGAAGLTDRLRRFRLGEIASSLRTGWRQPRGALRSHPLLRRLFPGADQDHSQHPGKGGG